VGALGGAVEVPVAGGEPAGLDELEQPVD